MAPRRDPLNADDILRRLAGSSGGGGSSSSSGGAAQEKEPSVFFGPGKMQTPKRPKTRQFPFYQGGRQPENMVEVETDTPRRPTRGRDDVRGLSAAQGEFYKWDDAQRRKWSDHLVRIGYIDPEDAGDYTTLLKAWQEVIGEAANFTGAGKKIDPWKVAELIAGADNDGGGAGGGKTRAGRERGFTGTRTATSSDSRVDLTDPQTAKALVNATLSKFLGRNASDEEIGVFASSLNDAERANPITATTTTTDTFDDGVQTASNSSTQTAGGLSATGKQQLMEDRSLSMPEYGAYQAASTYYSILQQAIQSAV